MKTRIVSLIAMISVMSITGACIAAPRSGNHNGAQKGNQNSSKMDNDRGRKNDDQRGWKNGDERGMKRGDERGMKMGHRRYVSNDYREARDHHTEVIIVQPSHRHVQEVKPYREYRPAQKANTLSINLTLRL